MLAMMLGPLKVAPTFAAVTRGLEAPQRSRIARRAVLIALIAMMVAIFSGHELMKSWGASPQAVAAAAGLLLSISSLQAILGSHTPAAADDAENGQRDLAMSPLAFPTLVPPYAIGVLIIFAAHFSQTGALLQMAGVAAGILLVDWVAMLFAPQILRVLSPTVLRVLGSVFAVLQLSVGIQMILYTLTGAK